MNLRDKQREFAGKFFLEPEFHAATMHHDPRLLEIGKSALLKDILNPDIPAIERIFLHRELDSYLSASLDIPRDCTADHFELVTENLGFERVGDFPSDRTREQSLTSVFARPDGLIITADYTGATVNGSELSFQWVSNVQKTGQDRPGDGAGGEFEKLSDGRWAYFGYYFPNQGEGIRSWLKAMSNRGQFLSPMQKPRVTTQIIALTSEIDKFIQREISGNNEVLMRQAINAIERERFRQLPVLGSRNDKACR